MSGLILPGRFAQQPQHVVPVDGYWQSRGLKFANLPPVGAVNLAMRTALLQSSGAFPVSISPAGRLFDGNYRAEYPAIIDATKGLTLISIWRARVGGDYLGADGERDILSTRTGGNQGWTWGRNNAIGGGATGNLTSQVLTFQGVAQYIEGNATIEAFVDTPVACRYNPVTGKISWFRFGAQSSADTTVGTPTAGGNLVFGAQGDYAGNGNPWIDRASGTLAFEGALSDAEIARLSGSVSAVFQAFKAPPRRLWAVSAAGTNTAINPGAGSLAITGYAPTIARTANQLITAGAGSLGITGYAPTIAQPQAVVPGAGALTIVGYAPTVTQAAGQNIAPGAGSIALTGYAPSVVRSANQSIVPGVGSLTITGFAPTVQQASSSQNVQPGAGVLSIVGYAPTVEQRDPSAVVASGGGAGDWRSAREYADRFDKADHKKPTKEAKRARRKQLEAEVLELLPDEPESLLIAPQIAQAVYRREAQMIARWTPPVAMMPVVMPAIDFDASEAIRLMVEQWQQNEAIQRELEDEMLIETLLLG